MPVLLDLLGSPLRKNVATARSGSRTHFNEIVSRTQYAHIMIDEYHRIAVSQQITHYTDQSLDIRRMQTSGRFVEHIQHTRRLIAHGAGELRTLPFTGRQRGARTVQRQVSQT